MNGKRALIVAALSSALLAALPATAAAQQPQCGDVITEDTTLKADIRCDLIPPEERPDVALTIGADDVTLDLGGYRVVGNFGDAGILNSGHDRVMVRNGTIDDFDSSLLLDGVEDNRLTGLSGFAFGDAIELRRSGGNVLRELDVVGLDFSGLRLDGSTDNLIVDSDLAAMSVGASIVGSRGNRFVRTSFFGEAGLSVSDSHDNRFADSTVRASSSYNGARITGSGNVVVRTSLSAGGLLFGWALRLEGDHNIVRDSSLRGGASQQPALELIGGTGNVIRGNEIIAEPTNPYGTRRHLRRRGGRRHEADREPGDRVP